MLGPGTKVGPFRLVEHVGAEGTMAEVYRAEDDAGQTVALKLIDVHDAQGVREVDAMSRLDHPNIVRTYNVARWEGRFCLVQEWVDGPSLETELATVGRLGLAEVVALGMAVAAALAYAHRLGILHRDLKPSNVLHAANGEYKVVDFGAVGLLEPGLGVTSEGEIAGTPLYMAPEQAVGSPQSPATDVFGLGLLMYRCLYGSVPGERSADYIQLLASRVSAEIDVPPSPLRDILRRCLARDPALRFQSAEALYTELASMAYQPAGYGQGTVYPQQGGPAYPAGNHRDTEPPSSVELWHVVVFLAIAVVVGAGLGWVGGSALRDPWFWLPVGGVVTAGLGFVLAWRVRRLTGRSPEARRKAAGVLAGLGDRDALTRSMVAEVDQVVTQLKGLDAKFLGLTMVMLIREAEEATTSADRVAALVQLAGLMERLVRQLSPWHVRHKDAIATVIAIVGSLVGVAGVVGALLR
jgi:Protein kinase domain